MNATAHRTNPYFTDGRRTLLTALVEERFAKNDDAGRDAFRQVWHELTAARTEVDTKRIFDAAFQTLKALPTLAAREAEAARLSAVPAPRPQYVSEVGYYRNPEDGLLYRIVERKEGLRVLVYSKTGGPRRLDVAGNLVKGKWVEKGKYDSARLRRGTIKAEWQIDEAGLLEFAYGFCPLHGGPLADGVSVALGYGPTCAEREGLPWSEAAARAVLEAQGIDADAFLAQHSNRAEG